MELPSEQAGRWFYWRTNQIGTQQNREQCRTISPKFSTGGRLRVHYVIAIDFAVVGLINLATVRLGSPSTFTRPSIDAFMDMTVLN